MFDFINTPTVDQQQLGPSGAVYQYDGTKWVAVAAQVAVPSQGNVGRNLIHNGLFNVQQRGNPGWTASGSYTADRWSLAFGGGSTTASIIPLADSDRAQIGSEAATSALRNAYVGGAAAGDWNQIIQRIENVRRLANVTVTVSFWARVISGGTALGVTLSQIFGGGGGGSPNVNLLVGTATLTATWQRFSFQRVMPSVAGKTFGASAGTDFTQLALNCSSGSTNSAELGVGVQSGTVDIWGIQLEIAAPGQTQPTPLERIEYADDLRHCQRFYQIGSVYMNAYNLAGGNIGLSTPLPAMMRATPTIALNSPGYANASGATVLAPTQFNFVFSATATTSGSATASANFTASADL
jgi:hypothetical protein